MGVRSQLAGLLLLSAAFVHNPKPLPPNYKVILDNPDVQVQRVDYGPHEFVPMHDHPAVATVYVYLNNSGVVDISHEGPDAVTVHRPPTHTGAFRISPGAFERHSVQNQSDLPSGFLRIELKHLPANSVLAEFRGQAPQEPFHSTDTEVLYDHPGLRIERTVCIIDEKCTFGTERAPSVMVVIPLESTSDPKQSLVNWFPANNGFSSKDMKAYNRLIGGLNGPWEILQIVLPKH
jgi:hypothetical protein